MNIRQKNSKKYPNYFNAGNAPGYTEAELEKLNNDFTARVVAFKARCGVPVDTLLLASIGASVLRDYDRMATGIISGSSSK